MEYLICGIFLVLCVVYLIRKIINPLMRECELCHVDAEQKEMGWGATMWICPNCGQYVE